MTNTCYISAMPMSIRDLDFTHAVSGIAHGLFPLRPSVETFWPLKGRDMTTVFITAHYLMRDGMFEKLDDVRNLDLKSLTGIAVLGKVGQTFLKACTAAQYKQLFSALSDLFEVAAKTPPYSAHASFLVGCAHLANGFANTHETTLGSIVMVTTEAMLGQQKIAA